MKFDGTEWVPSSRCWVYSLAYIFPHFWGNDCDAIYIRVPTHPREWPTVVEITQQDSVADHTYICINFTSWAIYMTVFMDLVWTKTNTKTQFSGSLLQPIAILMIFLGNVVQKTRVLKKNPYLSRINPYLTRREPVDLVYVWEPFFL